MISGFAIASRVSAVARPLQLDPLGHDHGGVCAANGVRARSRRRRRPSGSFVPSATGSQARTSAPSASRREARTIDGASRMSSVSGLKASPSSATVLAAQRAEMPLQLPDHPALLQLVHLDHRGEQLEVVARVRGELLERQRVLGEAGAAVADARAQKVRPEPCDRARCPPRPSPRPRPVASQTFAISLMNEMRVMRNAFAASLIISAEFTSVRTIGASIADVQRGDGVARRPARTRR